MKRLFIVFEGIDGSGTSTQANLLKDYFLNRGDRAIVSPEPSEGAIGKLIREALQERTIVFEEERQYDEQMAYLFAADRYYHLYNDRDGVFKLRDRDNTHVITPRYYFSSLAYNCNTLEEFEFVRGLNQRFPNPDLTIYLDLDIKIALERISDRPYKEIYENEKKLTRVKQNYQKIFNAYTGLLLTIDASQNREAIQQEITNFIQEKF